MTKKEKRNFEVRCCCLVLFLVLMVAFISGTMCTYAVKAGYEKQLAKMQEDHEWEVFYAKCGLDANGKRAPELQQVDKTTVEKLHLNKNASAKTEAEATISTEETNTSAAGKEGDDIVINILKDTVIYRKPIKKPKYDFGFIRKGEQVVLLEEAGNGWLHVKQNFIGGEEFYLYYVNTDYKAGQTAEYIEAQDGAYAIVTGKTFLRSAPSMAAEKVKKVSKGNKFDIIAHVKVINNENVGWHLLKLKDGTEAYIYGEYAKMKIALSLDDPEDSEPEATSTPQESETPAPEVATTTPQESETPAPEVATTTPQAETPAPEETTATPQENNTPVPAETTSTPEGMFVPLPTETENPIVIPTIPLATKKPAVTATPTAVATENPKTTATILPEESMPKEQIAGRLHDLLQDGQISQSDFDREMEKLNGSLEAFILEGKIAVPQPKTGYVIGSKVNFRSGPGMRFKIKRVITYGTKVGIISRKGEWYEVIVGKTEGWMHSQYVVKFEGGTFKGIKMKFFGEYKTSAEKPLTSWRGRARYNGHDETYYSETVLPGGGLNIPGRHVASDGTIRDKDGFICVAASTTYLPRGSKLMTSLGPGMVYDCGCAHGTVDIYVNGPKFKTSR